MDISKKNVPTGNPIKQYLSFILWNKMCLLKQCDVTLSPGSRKAQLEATATTTTTWAWGV
ncbi:hypothetical protein Hamer_G030578 [Homarus americanus]|uniref:Uncharacterized protein n=1 Tax=Homarus americanus TaxID=6706 RepID=A0A8J5K3T4_HOMAM|nr:hypothetical protein Hamer_G030578 [Homarus americanus]